MPQFDPSSFSSQIFWLLICFAVFYFAMSKIFLPKIRDIIHARHDLVTQNTLVAEQLQAQIDEINASSKSLRDTSGAGYNLAIDQAMKQANLFREQALSNLREKTTKMVAQSKEEIIRFTESTKNDRAKAIGDLVEEVSKKLLNS